MNGETYDRGGIHIFLWITPPTTTRPDRNRQRPDPEKMRSSSGSRITACSSIRDRRRTIFSLSLSKSFLAANGGREAFTVYELDAWPDELWGVRIIRLPPYHCQWNPIEFLWAQLKFYLRRLGHTDDPLELGVRNRGILFFENFNGLQEAALFEHCRRGERQVRDMLEEKKNMVEDSDFNDGLSDCSLFLDNFSDIHD
ncbi:unnamed protein product [Caenorhabditis sp. 36 PRJEB53466]|nr:unnamed protein product [Caenorhabditis sp. 36 PRJEB53466]